MEAVSFLVEEAGEFGREVILVIVDGQTEMAIGLLKLFETGTESKSGAPEIPHLSVRSRTNFGGFPDAQFGGVMKADGRNIHR